MRRAWARFSFFCLAVLSLSATAVGQGMPIYKSVYDLLPPDHSFEIGMTGGLGSPVFPGGLGSPIYFFTLDGFYNVELSSHPDTLGGSLSCVLSQPLCMFEVSGYFFQPNFASEESIVHADASNVALWYTLPIRTGFALAEYVLYSGNVSAHSLTGLDARPTSMAVNATGNVYMSTAAGSLYSVDGNTAAGTFLVSGRSVAIAFGPDGLLYSVDPANNLIQRFNTVTLAPPTSFPLLTTPIPVDPHALAIGLDGRLYVANGYGGGWVYDSRTGAFLGTLESSASYPDTRTGGRTSLAVNQSGFLYMYDQNTGLHVFNVGTVITLPIQIKPGSSPATINTKSNGQIPVAILSANGVNAATDIDLTSLTFGRTGSEQSLKFCNGAQVFNGVLGILCHFDNDLANFQSGDTMGILKGKTTAAKGGNQITGSAPINVIH
jgi:outer membrane protein assembly factor BamB